MEEIDPAHALLGIKRVPNFEPMILAVCRAAKPARASSTSWRALEETTGAGSPSPKAKLLGFETVWLRFSVGQLSYLDALD